MKIYALIFFAFLGFANTINAQTRSENSGWAALFYSNKFTEKIGMHFDVQARSSDDLAHLRNILLRPGITYFIDATKNVTVGYAYILTQQPSGSTAADLTEHRIWEQFIINHKLAKLPIAHRFRLEQRFIETAADDVFSQRIRYFFRSVIPLTQSLDKPFEKGVFASLQNEVFFHLQNKSKLNNAFFDQNRFYTSAGYRFSKGVDLEAGYLNQLINGRALNTQNHVIQLAAYLRF